MSSFKVLKFIAPLFAITVSMLFADKHQEKRHTHTMFQYTIDRFSAVQVIDSVAAEAVSVSFLT